MAESHASIDLLQFQPNKTVTLHSAFPECSEFANFEIAAFAEKTELVPVVDDAYQLNPKATLAILAGFAFNRRVLLQGMHGTGKSTHIEQIAARLNWPCMRINLDGQIARMDLIGKDTISIEDGKQITKFQEGLIPWSLQRPIALILDEYDAGQPDVMFVIQRMLEREGRLTLLDQNRVIEPNPAFRIFATSNTVGLGNWNGLYQGTQLLNHGQMDRWDIVAALDYLEPHEEAGIVLAKIPELSQDLVGSMVALANLTRKGFESGDLSTLMSTRTLITWGENWKIFKDLRLAFDLAFLNKCEAEEKKLVAEYFQRCFASELT
ncbi:AAA family ATPase [Polynucleobacter sp. 71A-WALBACH]|uniref:AAA family ATPase n=1 Tax=Polynucleobacter sp. 71A-WALBACH TaxID=2689097 RepID=UPI001C0B1CF2|nr:MoxR family ATPase [Polynucleobacter sp. 71A-WALBACH]MBU3594237.1 AAA family ATPase [Polynucleobacter sp. 71A-WALBACH]